MSAAKETLDGASALIGEEEEQIDESKLSWRERRRLNKQRKAEEPLRENKGSLGKTKSNDGYGKPGDKYGKLRRC